MILTKRASAMCIFAVLFQYHEHQYPIRGHGRNFLAGPLSCARSFTDSSHHFDSRDYKLRPLMVYHSENPRACLRFPFYAFSIYAANSRNATPAYNESHLYLENLSISILHSRYVWSGYGHRKYSPIGFDK
jgi:hypothetical protein